MPEISIYIEGGLVQEVRSDIPGVRYAVVDYDVVDESCRAKRVNREKVACGCLDDVDAADREEHIEIFANLTQHRALPYEAMLPPTD